MNAGMKFLFTLAFLVLAAAPLAFGQDPEAGDDSDLEGWYAAELRYRASRRWTFSGEGQLRLKDDMSLVDQYFGQLGIKYRGPADLSLDGGLRFIERNDTEGKIQGYESQRRQHVSLSYGPEVGRFDLGFRVRYQTKGDVTDDGYMETGRHWRFRARVRYNIRNWKLDPVFAVELFRPVDNEEISGYDKIRYTLSTDWESWAGGEIGMFYRIEKDLGVDDPMTTHIVGLRFTHSLGDK